MKKYHCENCLAEISNYQARKSWRAIGFIVCKLHLLELLEIIL